VFLITGFANGGQAAFGLYVRWHTHGRRRVPLEKFQLCLSRG